MRSPDAVAVVIGVGGLEHLGIRVLRATTGSRVIAVDARETARKLAERSGADLVIASGASALDEIRQATDGRGADVVLDFVGSDETLRLAAQSARMLGDLTIVGLGGGTLPVSFYGIPYEVSVQTTYWGNRAELVEVLDLAARGHLRPEITRFQMGQAEKAYEQLRTGEVEGRVVVVPNEA